MSVLWHAAIALVDLAEGQKQGIEIAGRQLIVCRTKEGIFALDGICSHAYALMHEGRLRGNRLICPLHGASFDCRSGAVLGAPANTPLQAFDTRVNEQGMIEVKLAD